LNTEPLDARYLMLSFNINQIGEIGSLAIFGQTKRIVTAAAPGQPGINGVPATTNPNQKSMDFDYGPAAYGSHVTHVSGGNVADAQKAIDGDPNTAVQLGQNPGQDNIMVLDLGATREISKLGLLFSSPGPGAFEFYFMNDLPNSLKNANEGNSLAPASGGNATAPTNGGNTTAPAGSGMPKTAMWRQPNGTLRPLLLAADEGSLAEALALAQLGQADVQTAYLPPDFFQTHQPNVVEKVKGNEERITMKFDKVPMRYVIVRWIPDSTGPNANTECSIYELHIIGQTPESYYLAAMAVNQFSSAESASSSAGSTSGNGGTGTGTAGGTNVGPPPPIVTQ
jgi:hypothetical protein